MLLLKICSIPIPRCIMKGVEVPLIHAKVVEARGCVNIAEVLEGLLTQENHFAVFAEVRANAKVAEEKENIKTMIQYLIILLDDTSVVFCHNANGREERRLIPLETLKAGILYGMKENLNIQFVYPDYALPDEYNEVIEAVDHTKIKPASMAEGADVVVIDGLPQGGDGICDDKTYVLRLTKDEMFAGHDAIVRLLENATRLNIVLTDVETFTDEDFTKYKNVLEALAKDVERMYTEGRQPQLNILTDRIMLDKMNNCGAGDTNITLAPDGRFYVCPAFYQQDGGYAVGSLEDGLDIKNSQLYKLDHAPLCRHCDAYQCRRCVWLNRKTTLEVNTPSHEQCVMAHLERNAARLLLTAIRKHGTFLPGKEEIKEIDYLDPFEVRKEW